jgi:hypothetical protein
MNAAIQNSATQSEALKARKDHLIALLKILDTKIGKKHSYTEAHHHCD